MKPLVRTLSLAAAVLVVAGCLTARDALVDRSWTLVEVHGAAPVAPGAASFSHDGSFTLQTGCNMVGGTYHLDGNRILLDTVHQSLMQCEGAVDEQENAVLAVVTNQPTYAIDTRTGWLRLTSTADQVLVFEP
jgi:heat shock protein HslJ